MYRLFFVAAFMCVSNAYGAGYQDFFPETADPFVGDYSGRWSAEEKVDPEVHAQIVALGGNKYRITLTAKLDMRCPPKLVAEAEAVNGVIAFRDGATYGEVKGDTITGGRGEKTTFSMKKEERLSPTLGAKSPAGAVVLFDGSNLDSWEGTTGWEIIDGAMMVTPKGHMIKSKQAFKDLRMHIEFRTPFMPSARGQERGNSGVFIQDVYEVQVLDSYGLEGYYDECGGLYKLAAPMVNACRPPLQWQTYDLEYTAPKFDASGKLTANGVITVHHNGVLIHDEQELKWITAWTESERKGPAPKEPGRIQMQGHNNYVQFRNIWVEEIEE